MCIDHRDIGVQGSRTFRLRPDRVRGECQRPNSLPIAALRHTPNQCERGQCERGGTGVQGFPTWSSKLSRFRPRDGIAKESGSAWRIDLNGCERKRAGLGGGTASRCAGAASVVFPSNDNQTELGNARLGFSYVQISAARKARSIAEHETLTFRDSKKSPTNCL